MRFDFSLTLKFFLLEFFIELNRFEPVRYCLLTPTAIAYKWRLIMKKMLNDWKLCLAIRQ